jgi:hypothetical protein
MKTFADIRAVSQIFARIPKSFPIWKDSEAKWKAQRALPQTACRFSETFVRKADSNVFGLST